MRSWAVTIAAGVVLGVLASIPALDGVLWRFAVFVAPWVLLLVGVPVAIVVGLVWLWKGRGW